ncbi:MAG TPA: YjbQ family protein [Dehalococcoidia bacterium]|nr:YjbQ family protein [Dehalococcoidia bacterium]
MDSASFEVRTGDQPVVVDITGRVEQALAGRGDGLAHIFVPHATAGLALIETGSGSERDLLDRLDALLPRDARYQHAHGAAGHGRDHLLPAFLPPAITLVVRGGRLQLGRWQSLVLVDTNIDNPVRTVQVTLLPRA